MYKLPKAGHYADSSTASIEEQLLHVSTEVSGQTQGQQGERGCQWLAENGNKSMLNPSGF